MTRIYPEDIEKIIRQEKRIWTSEIARRLGIPVTTVHFHLFGQYKNNKFYGGELRDKIKIVSRVGKAILISMKDEEDIKIAESFLPTKEVKPIRQRDKLSEVLKRMEEIENRFENEVNQELYDEYERLIRKAKKLGYDTSKKEEIASKMALKLIGD